MKRVWRGSHNARAEVGPAARRPGLPSCRRCHGVPASPSGGRSDPDRPM